MVYGRSRDGGGGYSVFFFSSHEDAPVDRGVSFCFSHLELGFSDADEAAAGNVGFF